MRKSRKFTACAASTVAVIFVILVFNYLTVFTVNIRSFSFCRVETQPRALGSRNQGGYYFIPRRIHQLFFNVTHPEVPVDLELARKSWILRNPNFNYTLWNSSMVLGLLESKYPELLPLYKSYSHWVRRADVARYVILYEYGGLYVDLDIGSRQNIDRFIQEIEIQSSAALYRTKPFGVSNDFMLATLKHPFFNHVICGLERGNRWFGLPSLTTIMSTGPGYLYSRYTTYDHQEDVRLLEESQLNPFIKHQDGAAWHGVDAKIIWWIFINWDRFMKNIFLISSGILILTWILFKFRHVILQGVMLFLNR